MIFVDSRAWIALASEDDQHHDLATAEHARLQKKRRRYATSNFVLGEVITHLYRKQRHDEANKYLDNLLLAIDQGLIQSVEISSQQFRRAWRMRQKYDDKPDISLVDFTSMVAMQDLRITEIFSGDSHFEHVGLGFRLRP